jgi:hypothetical protein
MDKARQKKINHFIMSVYQSVNITYHRHITFVILSVHYQ